MSKLDHTFRQAAEPLMTVRLGAVGPPPAYLPLNPMRLPAIHSCCSVGWPVAADNTCEEAAHGGTG